MNIINVYSSLLLFLVNSFVIRCARPIMFFFSPPLLWVRHIRLSWEKFLPPNPGCRKRHRTLLAGKIEQIFFPSSSLTALGAPISRQATVPLFLFHTFSSTYCSTRLLMFYNCNASSPLSQICSSPRNSKPELLWWRPGSWRQVGDCAVCMSF